MKAITIVANNRPEYIQVTADSLRTLDLDGWSVFVFSEPPGNGLEPLYEIADFIVVNPYKMGIDLNPFQALHYAFEKEKAEMVLFMEEDGKLSLDALDLCDWYYQQALPGTCVGMPLFNRNSDPEEDPHKIKMIRNFEMYALCLRKENWFGFVKRNWFTHSSGKHHALTTRLNETSGCFTLTPAIGRANHIGKKGYNMNETLYEKQFAHIRHYDGKSDDWRIDWTKVHPN